MAKSKYDLPARWDSEADRWVTDSGVMSGSWPSFGYASGGVAHARDGSVTTTESTRTLGTPRTADGMTGALRDVPADKDPRGRLEDQVSQVVRAEGEHAQLFRTPTAQLANATGAQHPDKRRAGGHGPTLSDEVEFCLPTPRASDGEKGGPNQRGSKGDRTLSSESVRLLPTPTASVSGNTPENHLRKKPGRQVVTDLGIIAEYDLFDTGGELPAERPKDEKVLPTPRATRGGSSTETAKLLPTPTAGLADGGNRSRSGSRKGEPLLPAIVEQASRGSAGELH